MPEYQPERLPEKDAESYPGYCSCVRFTTCADCCLFDPLPFAEKEPCPYPETAAVHCICYGAHNGQPHTKACRHPPSG